MGRRWPQVAGAGYSIAAVWGRGAPALPQGPFVTPGVYQLVLKVDGRTVSAPLTVKEDPRVPASPADLQASLAFSHRLDAGLLASYRGFAEKQAVEKQLNGLADALKAKPALAARVKSLLTRLGPATPNGPSFEGVNASLAGLEADAEAADTAPNPAALDSADTQLRNLEALERNWQTIKAGELAALNGALVAGGLKPVAAPPVEALRADAPPEGQDLP